MVLGWSYNKFLKDKKILHKPLKQNGHFPTTSHFFIRTITLNTWFVQKKNVKVHTSQRPKWPELIPVSLEWSKPRSIATPPGWDTSPSQGCFFFCFCFFHRRVTPNSISLVSIYTPGWRETKWSKVPCLRKQCEGRGLNHGPPGPAY